MDRSLPLGQVRNSYI